MNPNITANKAEPKKLSPGANGQKEIYYPSEERKKMGETDFHYQQIKLLMDMLEIFFQAKKDVYIASDIMFYYEEGNPNRRFAPDIMVCLNLDNERRRSYKLWKEKVVPAVIFEIASDATWEKDVTIKRRLYEKLDVAEYYVIDPEYKYLPQPLLAYRLEFGELVRQAVNDKRIFSPALKLELIDTGESFRLFDPKTKEFLKTHLELAKEVEELKRQLNKK